MAQLHHYGNDQCMLKARDFQTTFGTNCQKCCLHTKSNLHKGTQRQTPHEAQIGKKPSISHFKIFGCECFVHVPNFDKKKLQPKSIKCILLGYNNNIKAYKSYDPEAKKIIVSRNLVLKEQLHALGEEKESLIFLQGDEATHQKLIPRDIPSLKVGGSIFK